MFKPFAIFIGNAVHTHGTETGNNEARMKELAEKVGGEFKWLTKEEYGSLQRPREKGTIFGLTPGEIAAKQGSGPLK